MNPGEFVQKFVSLCAATNMRASEMEVVIKVDNELLPVEDIRVSNEGKRLVIIGRFGE